MTTTAHTNSTTTHAAAAPAPVAMASQARRGRRITTRQLATCVGPLAGVGLGVLSLGATGVEHLQVGDCIESLPGEEISEARTVACDVEHAAEVVGVSESVTDEAAAVDLCNRAFGALADVESASSLTGSTYQTTDGLVLCIVSGEGLTAQLSS